MSGAAMPRLEATLGVDLSALTALNARSLDFTPVWVDDVQPYVTDFIARRFATEGAYLGAAWAPLAPSTKRQRARPGRGRGGIGRDTNRMWASLVKSGGTAAAPGGLLAITPTRYERGSAVPYAGYFAFTRSIFPDPLPPELVTYVAGAVREFLARGAA